MYLFCWINKSLAVIAVNQITKVCVYNPSESQPVIISAVLTQWIVAVFFTKNHGIGSYSISKTVQQRPRFQEQKGKAATRILYTLTAQSHLQPNLRKDHVGIKECHLGPKAHLLFKTA